LKRLLDSKLRAAGLQRERNFYRRENNEKRKRSFVEKFLPKKLSR